MARVVPVVAMLAFAFVQSCSARTHGPARANPSPEVSIVPIGPELRTRMTNVSWRTGCPVPIESLRLLRVAYTDSAGVARTGELIANEAVAPDLIEIFQELHKAGFPLHEVETIEKYGGSDDLSMENNNTSAFNCRPNTTHPDQWSKHAFGLAIDINPFENPYARPRPATLLPDPRDAEGRAVLVEPAGAVRFLDRSIASPGMIKKGDLVWRAFTSRGWIWGGDFEGRVDYQHFEKPMETK